MNMIPDSGVRMSNTPYHIDPKRFEESGKAIRDVLLQRAKDSAAKEPIYCSQKGCSYERCSYHI